ncbi:MAG: DUF3307 domain-containing protein, partial [Paracoccaceae bacterium]
MIETLAALLIAHVVADFVLQTNGMVATKRQPLTMALHGVIVLVTVALALGSVSPWLTALTAAHLIIDALKTYSNRKGIWPFLADQAAHAITLITLTLSQPDLWAQGVWAPYPTIPPLMTLAAGLILATRAGGFAVGLLMAPWGEAAPHGLPGGGRVIGQLERGLIFLLILSGQAAGIGFLIAAKSVLRFSETKDDHRISEYVIIGTLASVTWAIAVSFAAVVMLSHLSPLGIPDLT